MIDKVLNKIGLIRKSKIEAMGFGRGRGIDKRLDEHRELVALLENEPDFFGHKFWVIGWLSDQDDYLMSIFYEKHGFYPVDEIHCADYNVRARPKVLNAPNVNL